MKKVQLISFDAAGTLIRHSWDPAETLVASARKAGIQTQGEAPKELYRNILRSRESERREAELRGDPAEIRAFWQKTIAEWLDAQGEDPSLSREIYLIARTASLSPQSTLWQLYPDVLPTLISLKEKKYKLAVVSNWDSTLLDILKNLQIASFFDVILASLPLGVEKPSPEIFHRALQHAEVSPEEALHIGDSWEDDVIGAQNAGISYLYLDRQSPPNPNTRRISSLEQIWEYLS
jgi:putative hydrolase of the HAD superfamily